MRLNIKAGQGSRFPRRHIELVDQLEQRSLNLDLVGCPRGASSEQQDNQASKFRLPQETGAIGQRRPLETLYQVRIRLDDPTPNLLPGAMGRVRIVAPHETLAARFKRWLARTFRLATA